MKAGGRNLKIKPTRANSWQRPCFLDRARLTGCLVLWRSPQLFFSFADLCVFPRIQWAIFVAIFESLMWTLFGCVKLFCGLFWHYLQLLIFENFIIINFIHDLMHTKKNRTFWSTWRIKSSVIRLFRIGSIWALRDQCLFFLLLKDGDVHYGYRCVIKTVQVSATVNSISVN